MTTWKHCERTIASILGGVRTGCNGESRRDVEHPKWSIEVKHRKKLPDWIHDAMGQAVLEAEHRVPIVVLHEKQMKYEDSYVILKIKDFNTDSFLSDVGGELRMEVYTFYRLPMRAFFQVAHPLNRDRVPRDSRERKIDKWRYYFGLGFAGPGL